MRGLTRARAMWLLLAAWIVLGAAQLPELHTMSSHGSSIFDFELVRTTSRAHEILNGWGSDGRSAARTSLWIDYGYLISYALLLMLGCLAIARRAERSGRAGWARAGRILAIAGLAAGLFDALENAALLRILSGHLGQPYPALAFGSALSKFVLSASALVYVVAGWLVLRPRLGSAKTQT
jgi:hypothetical protein